jgi:RNA-binding protein
VKEYESIVTIRVGKNGITTSLIEEIKAVLKKRKTVKVKMLKTSLTEGDKHEMAQEISRACRAKSAKMIGHIITLEK